MNRIGALLLVLLLAQLVLVVHLYRPERALEAAGASTTLADTGPFLVDEIRIHDGQQNTTVLSRKSSRWVLPEQGNLPADAGRIENLLEQLTVADPGWPVAHTLPARQRFQVAHYHFRRRIELWAQGEKVSSVFLGTSPGFRKVHARNANQDDIFSIELNLFETSAEPGKWLDGGLLQVRAPLRIVTDSYMLDRSGGEWRAGDGAVPESRELDALLGALRSLHVTGLASEEERDELAFAQAALILRLESLGGAATLELYALGDQYYVISSNYDNAFRLSPYSFDQLTGMDGLLLSGAQ